MADDLGRATDRNHHEKFIVKTLCDENRSTVCIAIKNYSFFFDVVILLQTVHTILWGRGVR